MLAARLHEWGSSPSIDEVPAPTPAAGESLVRVLAASVGHLDLTIAGGHFPVSPRLPYIGGVEGCGIVLESETIPVGSRVIVRGAGIGIDRDGCWAEYVAVPDTALFPASPAMTPELASAYFVPATTAHVALHEIGRLVAGETVVVLGAAGAVGSIACQLALYAGAQVIGVVSRAERKQAVPPGVECLSLDEPGDVQHLAADRRADLVVDTFGGEGLTERLWWTKPGGRVALVGYTQGSVAGMDLPAWLLSDVAVLPVNTISRAAAASRCDPELRAMLEDGRLTLNLEEFPLAAIGDAVTRLRSGLVRGRAVLTMPSHSAEQ